MKKSSLITKASSRRTSRNKYVVRILLVGIFVLLLVWLTPRLFFLASSLVMSPIYAAEKWFLYSQNSLPSYLRDRSELVAEINSLRNRPPDTAEDKVVIARLRKENQELRSLLHDGQQERIMSGVIGRPGFLPYDVLVLDKGKDDGIKEGAPVYVSNDTIIGVVSKVFNGTSVVELVTAPNFSTTVYIYGPDIYTNARGIGGGVLEVGVPQGIEINVGDVVVLPSAEGGLFGAIARVESLPTKPEQYGYVTTEVPISSLRVVAVGLDPLVETNFSDAVDRVELMHDKLFSIPVPEEILVDINSSSTATTTASTTSS